jgi:hypothetical protein
MPVLLPRLTDLAVVEIPTDRALVSNTHDWSGTTAIAFHLVMDNWDSLAESGADFVTDKLLNEGLTLEILLSTESLFYLFDSFCDRSEKVFRRRLEI